MSSVQYPSRQKIVDLMKKLGATKEQIDHGYMVADLALKIADRVIADGIKVDKGAVEAGSLLHDIGLVKTHGPEHAVIGGNIIKDLGLPEKVAKIAECHEPFSPDEAKLLGMKREHYIRSHGPETIEEKIFFMADLVLWMVKHESLDPWKDPEAPGKSVMKETDAEFRRATGKGITMGHPFIQRHFKITREMLKYCRPEDIEELDRKYVYSKEYYKPEA